MRQLTETYLRPASLLKLFFVAATAVMMASVIVLNFTPPVSRDALTHHLAVPKLYLKHGCIYEIPFMPFSYYPMNLDLLYLVSLYFGNDIIPKFIHFSFALLTAWLLFVYLKRRVKAVYGLAGALFFLSIPIMLKLSISVYVDLGLMFFSTASLFSLFKWMEDNRRLRYLIISGLFCGLAMGTKYNGLVIFVLLALFVPFIFSRYTRGVPPSFLEVVRHGLIFSFVALIVFSPWMIRNYSWTNNPIYPLYDQYFNPDQHIEEDHMSLFTYRRHAYGESWQQMALLPVRIFFEGQDGNPQYFDGKLNPFLLFFPFFALYRIRLGSPTVSRETNIMLAFAVLFFALAFFSSSLRIRYLAPIIPPLVVLSVLGVRKIVDVVEKASSPCFKWIAVIFIFLAVSFAFLLNGRYLYEEYGKMQPFGFLSGEVDRHEYIGRYRPEYPCMQYINENLPPDAGILFIYMGNRGYYCDRNYLFDMNNNKSMLLELAGRSRDPGVILEGLREAGITHLLICHTIFDKWIKDQVTPEERGLLKTFFERHVKLLFIKQGYGVAGLTDKVT